MAGRRQVVCSVSELAPGQRKRVEIAGRPIVVFNLKGEFFALLDRCPHEGGSLFHGDLVGLAESAEPGKYCYSRAGEFVRCAWHGWAFDVRNGQSWCDPGKMRVKTYPVEIEQGDKLTKGPYVAETFPVVLEENYILVEY